MTKELQKQEAIKRMQTLKMSINLIRELKKDVKYYSERQSKYFNGILYWISNDKQIENIVKEFEKKTNNYVYHAQLTHLDFGSCLSLMYVSDNEADWKYERAGLETGDVHCYVVNLDNPLFSEYGCIGIAPKNGGVTRFY